MAPAHSIRQFRTCLYCRIHGARWQTHIFQNFLRDACCVLQTLCNYTREPSRQNIWNQQM